MISRCASGSQAAAPAKRRTRLPYSSRKASRHPIETSSSRFLHPTSIPTRLQARVKAFIPNLSRPTYRRNDSLASFPKKITATGCCRRYERWWSSPCRMCWRIRHSRVLILSPVVICSSICKPKPRQRSSRLSISRCARAGCFFLVARRQLEATKAALRWSRRRLDFIGTLVEPVREISDFREISEAPYERPCDRLWILNRRVKPPWPTFASRWSWRRMLLPRSWSIASTSASIISGRPTVT